MHAALDSMATLRRKDEEFVQVNSIETGIDILSCLKVIKNNLNLNAHMIVLFRAFVEKKNAHMIYQSVQT